MNLLSERRLANILLFHRSAFHFVDFSRTVNRFGLTFPTLRIIGLLFKNTYIPKPFLNILIQEIKIRNHESLLVLFLLCGAACGVLVPLPGREPRPLTVDAQSLNRRTAGEVPVHLSVDGWVVSMTSGCCEHRGCEHGHAGSSERPSFRLVWVCAQSRVPGSCGNFIFSCLRPALLSQCRAPSRQQRPRSRLSTSSPTRHFPFGDGFAPEGCELVPRSHQC